MMMALFGLLWLMRIRAEVRKDKRKQQRCSSQSGGCLDQEDPFQQLLPPPVSFADSGRRRHSADDDIPPPPPPPLAQIHRRSSSIREGLNHRTYPSSDGFFRPAAAQSFSRSAQNLPLECTCPTGRPVIRQPAVRFCDDPLGFYSARRRAANWNYSTLPLQRGRQANCSRSAHGYSPFFICFCVIPSESN